MTSRPDLNFLLQHLWQRKFIPNRGSITQIASTSHLFQEKFPPDRKQQSEGLRLNAFIFTTLGVLFGSFGKSWAQGQHSMLCLFLSEITGTSSRARDGTQWGKWHQFSPRSGLEGKMGLERQRGVTGGSWPQVWEYGFSSPSTTSWVSLLTVDWKSVFTTCKNENAALHV